MPVLKNKATGEVYHVSDNEWKKLKHNKALLRGFEVNEAEEPEAVQKLKAAKSS